MLVSMLVERLLCKGCLCILRMCMCGGCVLLVCCFRCRWV